LKSGNAAYEFVKKCYEKTFSFIAIAILNDFLCISVLMNFGEIKFMFLSRPLAKKIYVIIRGFKFNPLELTHNCKLLTTDYNADHNGDGDSDNDSTIF